MRVLRVERTKSALLPKGGIKMNKRKGFNELVRFSGSLEAEPLAMLLKYGEVTFKLIKPPHPNRPFLPSSHAPVVVQVLNEDLDRAKKLLADYRKTQGVPLPGAPRNRLRPSP